MPFLRVQNQTGLSGDGVRRRRQSALQSKQSHALNKDTLMTVAVMQAIWKSYRGHGVSFHGAVMVPIGVICSECGTGSDEGINLTHATLRSTKHDQNANCK